MLAHLAAVLGVAALILAGQPQFLTMGFLAYLDNPRCRAMSNF